MEPQTNSLNQKAFIAFLDTLVSTRDGVRCVDGQKMDGTRARSYHRWTNYQAGPRFFAVDRWLSYFEIHIDDYFAFCLDQNLSPWAAREPDWHTNQAAR
jgi:hypothetical protein